MSFYERIIVERGQDSEFIPDLPVDDVNLISKNAVLCYTPDGDQVMFYQDIWNYKAYCSRSSTVYNFSEFSGDLKQEIKKIIYARIYFSPQSRSISSVRQTSVNHLGLWARNNKTTILRMLNDRRYYPFIVDSFLKLGKRSSAILLSLIREMRKIRLIHPQFEIAPPDDYLSDLLENTPRSNIIEDDSPKQTELIPSRLYSSLIICFESFLTDYHYHSQRIYKIYASFKDGFAKDPNFITRLKRSGRWDDFLNEHKLLEFSEKYKIDDKKQFNKYLTDVQNVARLWIHMFTGMRKTEVNTLPYRCLEEIETHGEKAYIISGSTSKLTSHNSAPTFWVTTGIINIGIQSAQSIGRLLALDRNYQISDIDYPLFPQFQVTKGKTQGRFSNAPYSELYSADTLRRRILERFPEILVTEADLRELQLFDGFRDWQKDCPIGKPWPLSTHQLRRSLAVYLARSGMVSIGAMQVQYKHLCSAMTSYYRKGSAFAVNFVDLDEECDERRSQVLFIESMHQEKRLAEFLNYSEQVMNNQERLWGGEGKRIRRAYEKGEPLVITTDRKVTQKLFERGEMTYKESPLGGCTKVGSCNRLSITKITPCIDCEHSILNETSLGKIDKEIANLTLERDLYQPDSLFYQHTQDQIDELKRKVEKARKGL